MFPTLSNSGAVRILRITVFSLHQSPFLPNLLTGNLGVCIKADFDGWAACIAQDDLPSPLEHVYNKGVWS